MYGSGICGDRCDVDVHHHIGKVIGGNMRVKAPFQGQWEYAGQGWDSRSYSLVRFVLRAYIPFHDPKGQPRSPVRTINTEAV